MQNESIDPKAKKTDNDKEKRIIHFLTPPGPASCGDDPDIFMQSHIKSRKHSTSLCFRNFIQQTQKSFKTKVNP